MRKIFVNAILNLDNVIVGVAAFDHTVLENISVVFKEGQLKIVNALINNPPHDGFHLFTRYCQYIILLQHEPGLGLTMKFSDYQNSTDIALDEYLKLKEKQWTEQDRNKIMQLFLEIKNSNQEKATMIIKDKVDLPSF